MLRKDEIEMLSNKIICAMCVPCNVCHENLELTIYTEQHQELRILHFGASTFNIQIIT